MELVTKPILNYDNYITIKEEIIHNPEVNFHVHIQLDKLSSEYIVKREGCFSLMGFSNIKTIYVNDYFGKINYNLSADNIYFDCKDSDTQHVLAVKEKLHLLSPLNGCSITVCGTGEVIPNKNVESDMSLVLKGLTQLKSRLDGTATVFCTDSCFVHTGAGGISCSPRFYIKNTKEDFKGIFDHAFIIVEDDASGNIAAYDSIIRANEIHSVTIEAFERTVIYNNNKNNLPKISNDSICYNHFTLNGLSSNYINTNIYLNENRIYYKCVGYENDKYFSTYDTKFTYEIGKTYENELNEDLNEACASGLHCAPFDWVMRHYVYGIIKNRNIKPKSDEPKERYTILEVEVPSDAKIICPNSTNGKIRTNKLKILREVPLEELLERSLFAKFCYEEYAND